MADAETKSESNPPPATRPNAIAVIISSATEALGSAFMLWILGGIAISIAGSFASGMLPSPPPGFGGKPAAEDNDSGDFEAFGGGFEGSAFGLFFAIFFAHSLWVGFRGGTLAPGRRLGRILTNLRENWFGLVVGNAISAWVAVLVLGIMQNFTFSLWRLLGHAVLGIILPVVGAIARFFFGAASVATVGDWLSWYDANEMNLTFWVIYLGGALDDLGVPNFKTLVRWGWCRWRKRAGAAPPAATGPGEAQLRNDH
jgi:hypothetical protein